MTHLLNNFCLAVRCNVPDSSKPPWRGYVIHGQVIHPRHDETIYLYIVTFVYIFVVVKVKFIYRPKRALDPISSYLSQTVLSLYYKISYSSCSYRDRYNTTYMT